MNKVIRLIWAACCLLIVMGMVLPIIAASATPIIILALIVGAGVVAKRVRDYRQANEY